MALRYSHQTAPLAINNWLAFGNKQEGEHSGIAVVKIPVNATQSAAAAGAEYDTGFDLQAGWTVLDAWVVVNTRDATETVDIGTNSKDSGDADGLIVAASLATAGLVYPDATVTVGATETYYSANTRGALLSDYIVGSDVDQDYGLFHPKPFTVGTTIDLTFTTSAGTDTAVFDIYLLIYDPSPGATIDVYSKETMAAAS